MSNCAPVVIYTYTRIDHLKKVIEALKNNHLASKTDVFIVSDGPKNEAARESVSLIRNYIDSIVGFNEINRIYRQDNVGVFNSVLMAERSIMSDYGRLITLEDDIVTAPNFLDFINSGLNYYEFSEEVYTISGYLHPIEISMEKLTDSWKSPWFCPWGYGVWKRKHDLIDIRNNPLDEIRKNKNKFRFLKKYGDFFLHSLEADLRGRLVVADARVCAQMLLNNLCTVMPIKSKVLNIGLDGTGANCASTNIYDVKMDDGQKRQFVFSDMDMNVDDAEVAAYLNFMNGGTAHRLQRKIRNGLGQVQLLRSIKSKLVG